MTSWRPGSGPRCGPPCPPGTYRTRSTRCRASPGRYPVRSWRSRCARSCSAPRWPTRPILTPWPTRRCWRGSAGDDPGTPRPQHGRSFGEEGGRLTYDGYLRLPELLELQTCHTDPPAHDELLFITVHQVYELWFGQVLYELEAVRDAMLDGETWRARHLLRRVHAIERLLVTQVDILETMTPQDFLEFREGLAPASGFQSAQ